MMTEYKLPVAGLQNAVLALAPVIFGLVLGGCATTNTATPAARSDSVAQADFRTHVEDVFRFQNRVASDLITRYELSADPVMQPTPELLEAEDSMSDNCRALNEVVAAAIDGEEPDLALKLRLMKSLDDCDAAAHRVAGMIYGTDQAVVMKVAPAR